MLIHTDIQRYAPITIQYNAMPQSCSQHIWTQGQCCRCDTLLNPQLRVISLQVEFCRTEETGRKRACLFHGSCQRQPGHLSLTLQLLRQALDPPNCTNICIPNSVTEGVQNHTPRTAQFLSNTLSLPLYRHSG